LNPVEPARLRWWWMAAALAVLAATAMAAVLVGAVAIHPGDVLRSLIDRLPFVDIANPLDPRQEAILWDIRVPRVVLGGIVGAMLALAGGGYQGAFRNPLADPYLLGVAAGAGLGATLAIAYLPGTSSWPIDPLPLLAFVGGLGAVLLTYLVGYSVRVGRTAVTLILAGVAVAAFLTAIQTFLLQRQAETLRQVYGWILGRLTTVGWNEVLLILPYVVVAGAVVLLSRRRLDVLSVGDEEAHTLGVDAGRVRLVVVVAATLGTAAVVAVSGLIGFVGIIVPHTVRIVYGTSYKVVLPLAVVYGAAFLIVCDLIARTVVSPGELPIGVVTAFFGAPFFALVLRSSRGVGA
jgi:cobalamin transport system permease protein